MEGRGGPFRRPACLICCRCCSGLRARVGGDYSRRVVCLHDIGSPISGPWGSRGCCPPTFYVIWAASVAGARQLRGWGYSRRVAFRYVELGVVGVCLRSRRRAGQLGSRHGQTQGSGEFRCRRCWSIICSFCHDCTIYILYFTLGQTPKTLLHMYTLAHSYSFVLSRVIPVHGIGGLTQV